MCDCATRKCQEAQSDTEWPIEERTWGAHVRRTGLELCCAQSRSMRYCPQKKRPCTG